MSRGVPQQVVQCHHGGVGPVKAATAVVAGGLGFGWWWNKHHPDSPPVTRPVSAPAPARPKTIVHTVIHTVQVQAHPLLTGSQVVGIVALICVAIIACLYVWGRWFR